jgi:hypothetical protein
LRLVYPSRAPPARSELRFTQGDDLFDTGARAVARSPRYEYIAIMI